MIPLAVPPQGIRANVARARAQLHRGNLQQSLDSLSKCLHDIAEVSLASKALFELEVNISEILSELVNHKDMEPVFAGRPHIKRKFVYTRGNETPLAVVLEGLATLFGERSAADMEAKKQLKEARKQETLKKAAQQLELGNKARAMAYMRRLIDEFGDEPSLIPNLTEHLEIAGMYHEAAEFYEEAISRFPKNAAVYRGAAIAWMHAKEFAKSESIFLKVLNTFGGHASTYGNMAKLYLAWGHRHQAEEAISKALALEPTQPEALEVAATLFKRD